MSDVSNIGEMEGKTIYRINQSNFDEEDYIEFICTDGWIYKMYHTQDCCENVTIDDIIGDLSDLLDTPLTMADESCNSNDSDCESETWTFYRFATVNGYITIRWHGTSNGYYSESVDVYKRYDIQKARKYKLGTILDNGKDM